MGEKKLEVLRKHWSEFAVIMYPQEDTGDSTSYTNVAMRFHPDEVPNIELQIGELGAEIFQVGCYTVRIAQRIYCKYEPGYSPDKETPANLSTEEMEKIKANFSYLNSTKYRIVMEVMARHIDNPNHEFVYICRAAEGRAWGEAITDIFTAKASPDIPDEYSALFVCHSWSGATSSNERWYILAPTGKVTEKPLNTLI